MEVYWIPGPWRGRLAILPRPRGGDWLADDVRSWRQSGFDIVVSLLTPEEANELALAQEEQHCKANGIQYVAFPVADRGVPSSPAATLDLVSRLDKALAEGKNIGIHCRQGIGRSPLIAAYLLVLSGMDLESAFQQVSSARGYSVPETTEQREWVTKHAHTTNLAKVPRSSEG